MKEVAIVVSKAQKTIQFFYRFGAIQPNTVLTLAEFIYKILWSMKWHTYAISVALRMHLECLTKPLGYYPKDTAMSS